MFITTSSLQHHQYLLEKEHHHPQQDIIIIIIVSGRKRTESSSSSSSSNTIDFQIENDPLKTTILYKVAPRKFHIIINIAPLKNPKIRKRWPILPFENNHFLQGRPPKISYNHQHRPIKNH